MSATACREGSGYFFRRMRACLVAVAGVAASAALVGCTSRGMTVTSLPPGAEVSINRRVVGKTPIRVNYTHYGSYRMELRKDRYQPRVTTEKMKPPVYGYDPIAFVADNMLPARINDEVSCHYVLQPVSDVDQDALLNRAAHAREGKVVHPFTDEAIEVVMESQPPVDEEIRIERSRGEEGPKAKVDLIDPTKAKKKEETIIKVKPPEGPKFSKELGIKAPEEAKKDPEKASKGPKRMRRTPKGEIMIYEDEPIEDPDKKK